MMDHYPVCVGRGRRAWRMRHAEYTAQEVRTHCSNSPYSSMFDMCLEI